jgi:alpha-L-fucosidase
MGTWLAQYGESIYGTRGGPFKPGDYGVSTRKGNTVYLHVKEWIEDTLNLPVLPAKVLRSRVLGGGKAEVGQTEAGLQVSVPEGDRQPLDTVVVLELDRSAVDLTAVDVPAAVSLARNTKATASNVYQQEAQYGPDKAVDGKSDTRWATDSGTTSAWLEVDLGKPTTFRRAVIKQAYPELKRIRKYAVEYWRDGAWERCHRGETLGASLSARFEPVTAQRVRLHIIEATDGPTVWEFQLFK